MSPQAELIDEGLRMLEDVQGNPTFVYRGRHWACSYGPASLANSLVVGGLESDDQQLMTVRYTAIKPLRLADNNNEPTSDDDATTVDDDTMPPRVGKRIIGHQNGKLKDWRILRVEEGSACWHITLGSPHK